jgi:inner membrane protein
MDSLTQAALGAAIGEAILGKKIGHKGAIIGAVVATIPDLDVLLTPFFSALQKISIHRGYSHSIVFSLLLAFLLMYILSKSKWTASINKGRLWLFSFLALFTHILLDTFTTYGTQLFLPFSDWRVGFDSINIVDPLYTVPLLIGVSMSLFYYQLKDQRRSWPNRIGLLISSAYLLFTLANKQNIEHVFKKELTTEGIRYHNLLTVPVGIGNMAWYGVAKNETDLYIGRYSYFGNGKIQFEQFPINAHLLDQLDPELVRTMKWFAKGFYTVAERKGIIRIYNMQCDMQGIRHYGDYKAPTAFYFQIDPHAEIGDQLSTGMHTAENE